MTNAYIFPDHESNMPGITLRIVGTFSKHNSGNYRAHTSII